MIGMDYYAYNPYNSSNSTSILGNFILSDITSGTYYGNTSRISNPADNSNNSIRLLHKTNLLKIKHL